MNAGLSVSHQLVGWQMGIMEFAVWKLPNTRGTIFTKKYSRLSAISYYDPCTILFHHFPNELKMEQEDTITASSCQSSITGGSYAAALTSIFCVFFCASAGFCTTSFKTPLLNFASTFEGSALNGSFMPRSNVPSDRSTT